MNRYDVIITELDDKGCEVSPSETLCAGGKITAAFLRAKADEIDPPQSKPAGPVYRGTE